MTSSRRPEAGITLIELMISLLITSVAVAAAFGMAYSMMNGYRDHQRAMGVEQAARGTLDIIANAARSSSPAAQSGKIQDLVRCTSTTVAEDAIRVANDFNGEGADAIEITYASGGIITSLVSPYSCQNDGGECSVLFYPADNGGFSAGDFLVLARNDFQSGVLLEVAGVHDAHLHIVQNGLCELAGADAITFPTGALVMRARQALFYVDTTSFAMPMLMIDPDGADGPADPEPVAEGIEDLQVAVGIDLDGDGAVTEVGAGPDDDEWFYNVAGDTPPTPTSLSTPPWRALRLTIVARSTREVTATGTSFRPPAEDRSASGTADGFKRRTLTTVVELRNFGGSP